jgi:hypothetical protein
VTGSTVVRIVAFFRRPTPPDPPGVDRLHAELAAVRAALARHDASARALQEQLDRLDERVTAVSTELVNQLTELGHDIDALGSRPAPDGVDPQALAAVKEGQVRLANEQARYQIAFREDLARLAAELKRPR